MQTIYVENELYHHPRVQSLLKRFSRARVILCDHYGEVFNRKAQHFRLQKEQPALILARKHNRLVLPTPESFGIGGQHNYYFSHLLNCPYDCRYCFLQGMYPSAHYVLFINYDDFMTAIDETCAQHPNEKVYFFSGYDADSLGLDSVSEFVDHFLPFFAERPHATLELRTKSTHIRSLIKHPAIPNCVVAFSFTPHCISSKVEHKVPHIDKRLQALKTVAEHGYPIGLRFDPLIEHPDFHQAYQDLIQHIFTLINPSQVHSVSVGPLRFPEKMYQKIVKLYPDDALLHHPFEKRHQHYSYSEDREQAMKSHVLSALSQHIDKHLIFECHAL